VFLVVHGLVLINTDSNMHGDKIKKKEPRVFTVGDDVFSRLVCDPGVST
jgi:hypothetical protein